MNAKLGSLSVAEQQFDDEIDLGELFLTVLGEWRVVASIIAASLFAAVVYAFGVAPTQYRAEASIRSFATDFCPPQFTCISSIENAIAQSASLVATPEGFAALDQLLALSGDEDFVQRGSEFQGELALRNFFAAINVDAEGSTASVAVTHSSELRAVELANAIAAFMVRDVTEKASDNYAFIEAQLRFRLATLPAQSAAVEQSDALIQLERSALQAQLQSLEDVAAAGSNVAIVDLPALMPLALVSPRRSLIVALGAILGAFVGIGAAIIVSLRKGRLHGVSAIASAFGGSAVPITGRLQDIESVDGRAFWQEIRVALGEVRAGAITLTGTLSGASMHRAAVDLASEFAGAGIEAAIVEVGSRMPPLSGDAEFGEGVVSLDFGPHLAAYGCSPRTMDYLVSKLLEQRGIVIIVPPHPEADLPSVRDAIEVSQARIFMVSRGNITRREIGRLLLAERDAEGRRVLAVV